MKKVSKQVLSRVGLAKRPLHNERHDTYIYNPLSEAQTKSAKTWASVEYVYPNGSAWCERRRANPDAVVDMSERLNVPMKNLWLLDVEHRREGGVAYKVVNKDDNTVFDLREDQVFQAMIKYGVEPGGKLGGSWVFGMNHSYMKCYLVDSVEYKQLLSNEGFKEHPVSCE